MYECNFCLTKIKKQNKNKHEKSMKHRYFLSNMIVNKYNVKNNDITKFKNILQSYYDEHKKKFNESFITIIWKKNEMIVNKISIPCTITLQRTHMLQPDMFDKPLYVKVSKREFPDIVDRNCVYNMISDEIDIKFISKFKEITLQNYMKQPRSRLYRRLERNFIAEGYPLDGEYGYIFLSYCFRQIGFQPSPLLNILLPRLI